ncbi:glycosyltransferase family 2 protein [Candidatus Woesearchaeota archaeon]|nr:glycosyltransferase family 2 protein [Candidatus Woesearchaeota archaeon]
MKYPFISLVVVNYNGEEIIGKCLSSLVKADYPKNKYEIIAVDNASTDNSLSIIKGFPKAKIIRNKTNLGYVGVNSCLGRARGKYIFVLNNDLEMEKKCLKKAVEAIEKDNSIGVIAPKFVNYYSRNVESNGTWVSRSFYTGHYIDRNEEQKAKEIPYLGIEMIRADIAKKFGYIYDKDYFIYGEDLDLSLRFRLLGYKTMYVPDAVIYHMHAATTKKSRSHKMTFLLERNLLMTYFKILSFKNTLLFFPYVFSMRMIGILKDILTLQLMNAFARIKAIFWIAAHFPLVMKKRKKIQGMRKKTDKFLLEVFSEKRLFGRKTNL